ncbi:hypothetical protein [Paenibacillus sp. RC73]|uniref:hypothetical protein n=1 Tax=Paenibacillus sp. RC73 TaxID=3156250 RepID=UPI003851380B
MSFLSDLMGGLFQALFNFLKMLLRPLFILVAMVLYLVYKIAEVAWLLIQIFYMIGKIVVAFVKGIFITLAGFTYNGNQADTGTWAPIIKNVATGLNGFQFDKIAYVLLFIIWFMTAWAVIRIIGSFQNAE